MDALATVLTASVVRLGYRNDCCGCRRGSSSFWFEHAGDASSDTFGTHTLVLADHADAFADGGPVRYHRSDATERADSIQQWSSTRRWQTGRLSRASWDYRSLGLRPASADGESFGGVTPEDSDTAGPYGWHDSAEGERRARQHLEALQAESRTTAGAGTWRRLAPGLGFELTQHPALREPEAARFTCLQVCHDARNNLGAEVHTALEQLLGPVARAGADLPEALAGLVPLPGLEPLSPPGRRRTVCAPLARVRRSARAAGAGRGAERGLG